jgi:ABC-type Fe3+-hydroxamate transport system substrate-binding protein
MPEVDVAAHESHLRQQWAELSDIPAVRNNRLYFLSDDNALIPSPRYVQFIEKVAALLHPDGNPR